LPDSMVDAYFARIHGKPYFILDESVTRQSHQMGQLPAALSMAIYAITLRFVSSLHLLCNLVSLTIQIYELAQHPRAVPSNGPGLCAAGPTHGGC
jgi:hypothetical protein